MKNLIVLFFTIALFSACSEKPAEKKQVKEIKGNEVAEFIRNPVSATDEVDPEMVAKMTFEETDFNFGTVKEGNKITHIFKFKNTGKVPLMILDARSTCGCTVPSYPEDLVQPGTEEEIKVVFDTHNKLGNQHKEVTIISNTYPRETKIHLRGQVNK